MKNANSNNSNSNKKIKNIPSRSETSPQMMMITKYVDYCDITPAMVLNFNKLVFGSLKSPKKQDSTSSDSDEHNNQKRH